MAFTKKNDTAGLVDQLGMLKAQIADLTEREASLKKQLVDSGRADHEGTMFRATVSRQEREGRDAAFKTLIEELVETNTSPQYRSAHTIRSEVVVVRVVAKTRKTVEA